MSKKRKNKLLKGKFYTAYPVGGHPSLIYKKNKKKNRYDAIVFGTTPGKHRTELKNPINPNVNKSVVHNRPIRGTRKDFGDKELAGLKIHPKDKVKIKIVKRRTPQETNNYKKQKEIKKSR